MERLSRDHARGSAARPQKTLPHLAWASRSKLIGKNEFELNALIATCREMMAAKTCRSKIAMELIHQAQLALLDLAAEELWEARAAEKGSVTSAK